MLFESPPEETLCSSNPWLRSLRWENPGQKLKLLGLGVHGPPGGPCQEVGKRSQRSEEVKLNQEV